MGQGCVRGQGATPTVLAGQQAGQCHCGHGCCPTPPSPSLQGARGRRLAAAAVRIQAAFRGLHARRELVASKAAAIRIQVRWLCEAAWALSGSLASLGVLGSGS